MDVVVSGRHCEVPEGFRAHVNEKLARIGRFDRKAIRVEVELTREPGARRPGGERVELTVVSRGPAIRAEAAAADRYGAFEIALDRLEHQLRKAADRRRVHKGTRAPVSVARATAELGNSAERAASG